METNIVILGDCLDVLRELPDNSIDSVVTDPPYGLSKEPDIEEVLTKWMAGEDYEHRGGGFMGKTWDSFVPGPSIWREVYRVLKPGGHALVFAGTRTQDLMTISLRLAGFEIRDVIEWLYFNGFPKSLDVGKAFDKRAGVEREVIREYVAPDGNPRTNGTHFSAGEIGGKRPKKDYLTAPATPLAKKWNGWGTALKPSHEPIIYARKPFNSVPLSGVMEETTILLEVALCLLLSSVNGAERIFRLNPSELNGESDFAVMSAALLHGERSGELKELMVTFNSPETVLTCLNIATLWNNILEESLKDGSMFTTKTETSLTTALKTLKLEADKRHLTIEGITGCIRQIILLCKGNNIKALPNTGWLWRSILEGILSLMSWFTTRMVSEMITGLKTLNCGLERDIQTAQELIKSMLTRFQTYVNELPNLKESWQN